jgi:hypothetical protein
MRRTYAGPGTPATSRISVTCRSLFCGAMRNGLGRWSQVGTAFVAVGSIVMLAGTVMTWLYTGRRGRNLYDVVALARRFEVVPADWMEQPARVLWLFPVVSAGTLIALVLAKRSVALVGASLQIVTVCLVGIPAFRGPFRTGWGVVSSVAGATCAVVGIGVWLVSRSSGTERVEPLNAV